MKTWFTLLAVAIAAALYWFWIPKPSGTSPAQGDGVALVEGGQSRYTVILPATPTPVQKKAAEELAGYLQKVSGVALPVQEGGEATPAIYIKTTEGKPEEWRYETKGGDLFLSGNGPRGTLYSVYHFLEKELGVRWWNPWEESVPSREKIMLPKLERSGRPAFSYRDIFTIYGDDEGAFAARNRLNRQGTAPIVNEFGGGITFGPPYFCHTFYHYISAEEYFSHHPEWFALVNGKRRDTEAQLCLTNAQMRGVFLEKLKTHIRTSQEKALAAGEEPPLFYSVDQNDYDNYCQCPDCDAITQKEGSDAGPILDFVNWLAGEIEGEYPHARIVTFAYLKSEKPPRHIRPHPHVYIRLTDTTSSVIHPVEDPVNHDFADKLKAWSSIADRLLVWDYAVTYSEKTRGPRHATGVPIPTIQTFASDYRFMLAHHVEGVMVEHEFPILADLRDLKVWMMCKLLEEPSLDPQALLVDFTDGYYGKAGKFIREYLVFLERAARQNGDFIEWFAPLHHHRYLTLDFFRQAHRIFDTAQAAVKGDAVLERRLEHARLGVDRATLLRQRFLVNQWLERGGENRLENVPLDFPQIATRMRRSWHDLAKVRKSHYAGEKVALCERLYEATMNFRPLPIPEPFASLPAGRVTQISPFEMREARNSSIKLVADEEAPCGWAMRWEMTPQEISETVGGGADGIMPAGVYEVETKKSLATTSIAPEAVKGPGYHWYPLGRVNFTSRDAYVYTMKGWHLQADLETLDPAKTYEIWLCARFEGPGYPEPGRDGKTVISVERFLLVEAEEHSR